MTDIQLTFAPGTNLDMMVTYEMASRVWENYLGDDATVNIYVGASNLLPTHVAGGALPGIAAYQQYGTFRTQLAADATTADDLTAVSNLKTGDTFDVNIGLNFLQGNPELKMTRANAKSIGMVGGADTMLDGVILMNDLSAHPDISWDYNAVDISVGSSELEAMSVALHEIGHILGFVSGVDAPGWLSATLNLKNKKQEKDYYASLEGNLSNVTPLDMFRQTTRTSDANNHKVDLSIGEGSYFSIDSGFTNLANFSQGVDTALGGDGYQASHWKNATEMSAILYGGEIQTFRNPIGVMDPTIALGERMTISDLDLRAFDVIGWDRQSAVIDLATLQTEAKTHLANQLGQDVTWLESNSTTAAETLTTDRFWNVAEMIIASEVYDSLWGGGGGNWQKIADVYDSLWGGGSGSWQEIVEAIFELMWQTAAFSTFEVPETQTSAAPIVSPSVPPVNSFTGTPNVSPEDILDQGADELLQGGSLQPEKPETELDLDIINFGESSDPFAALGIGNRTDDPLLPESDFGLDLPGGVATWFEGASLGVSVST